jgi:hypothetical protein
VSFEEEPFVNRKGAQVVVVPAFVVRHALSVTSEMVTRRFGVVEFRVASSSDPRPYDGFRVAQRTCYRRVVTAGPGFDFVEV